MTSENIAIPSIGEPSLHASEALPSPTTSSDSSIVASEDDAAGRPQDKRLARPKLGSRKSSGTMIVPREAPTRVAEPEYDEGDVRTMSPRRSSEEVDRLGEEARRDMIEQAKTLQTSLQAIVDRVETVKSEHEKLEGGNKFLQSYVLRCLICVGTVLTGSQIHWRTDADVKDHIASTFEVEREGQKRQMMYDGTTMMYYTMYYGSS